MKIKGMLFILFAACVGHIGAMDPDESAEEQLQRLIKEKFPMELHFDILDQMMKLPFPRSNQGDFAKRYLNYLMSRDKDRVGIDFKKIYLNKFAKKWYLTYGRELKLPATWIKKYFPGQTPEQVLDYGLSIQDYLDSPVLKEKIQIKTTRGEVTLDLSKMKINDLNGLQKIPNIETVQKLYLDHNQLTTIQPNTFAGLTNLTHLSISRNQLTTIQPNAFAGLNNLQWLFLNNNQLNTIQTNAFAGLTNLRNLLLYNNQLSTILPNTFAGLPNLQMLSLNINQLSTILPNTFAGLTNLRVLDLNNNQLKTIQPGAFTGLTNLETLSLSKNPLDPQAQKAIKEALPAVDLY